MKRILFMCFIAVVMVFASCSKTEQPTYNLQGNYSMYEQANYQGIQCPLIDQDTFLVISKVIDSKFKTSGYFETTGTIVGGDIYLNRITDSIDNHWYGFVIGSIDFSNVKLNGNVLTFEYLYSTRTPYDNYVESYVVSVIGYKN